MSHLKYKDILDLKFSQALDNLEKETDVSSTINTHNVQDEPVEYKATDKANDEVFEKIARRSPQEAVYAAWLDLEKAFRYMFVRIGGAPAELSDVPEIAQYLYSNKYISESARNLLLGLRELRIDIARGYEADEVTYESALRYYKLTNSLIQEFNSIEGEYFKIPEGLG
ncbi:hypothetical protein FC605_11715 [Bacillus subtilis]|uniref:hypothetical protein n=1 Tax=Bacillus subtilis TaxID=1423 RepID=UPI0010FF737E|nr:hypothetical protein [Bacillus subtilis]QCU15472.1 hypothetical protein FC605_11715 [Bacillus subtilis]